jgi:hypothetical protein
MLSINIKEKPTKETPKKKKKKDKNIETNLGLLSLDKSCSTTKHH